MCTLQGLPVASFSRERQERKRTELAETDDLPVLRASRRDGGNARMSTSPAP